MKACSKRIYCTLLAVLCFAVSVEAASFVIRDSTNQSCTLQKYRHSKGSCDDTADEYEIKVPTGKYAEVRVSGYRITQDVECASALNVDSRQYLNSDIVLTCDEGTSYVTVRLAVSIFDYQIHTCKWKYYIDITYYDLVSTYTITYRPGNCGMGSPQTATKTKGEELKLKDAIFTRTGYLQTGWSKDDGGAKTYDLGAIYTADAALTLYPFWTQRVPAPDLVVQSVSTTPSSPIMKGERISMGFTVLNVGEKFAMQTIAQIRDHEVILGEVVVESLPPGGTCVKLYDLPTLTVGGHSLSVSIVSVSGETETENNSESLEITIRSLGGFSVMFDANGGEGAMDNQEFEGQTLKLAPNRFSKEGYVFVGWSRFAAGMPCYADESVVTRKALSITDPNPIGDSQTLYAAWGKEMARSITDGILERLYPNVVFYTGGSDGSWSESTKTTLRSNGRTNWIAAKVRGPGVFSYTSVESSGGNDVADFYGFVGGSSGYEGLVVEDLRDYFSRYGQFDRSVTISSEIDCVLGWGWYSSSNNGDYMQLSDVSWIPENAYEVRFDAHSGTGSVPSMSCEPGRIYNLPKNEFTNGNRRFAGWACSNGRRYDDGMLVFNLAQPGETVTMTAIWE